MSSVSYVRSDDCQIRYPTPASTSATSSPSHPRSLHESMLDTLSARSALSSSQGISRMNGGFAPGKQGAETDRPDRCTKETTKEKGMSPGARVKGIHPARRRKRSKPKAAKGEGKETVRGQNKSKTAKADSSYDPSEYCYTDDETDDEKRRFKCKFPGCNAAFSVRFSRSRHLKTHFGVKPHACDVPGCGKRFAEKSTLHRHLRHHTGEKPYVCQRKGCDAVYADLSNMKRHMAQHNSED